MATHFSIHALELHDTMKGEKDMTLKDERHRSVGAQYPTREEQRKNSRNNEEMEPKQKHHPVVDVTGDGSKVNAVKSNTAQEIEMLSP